MVAERWNCSKATIIRMIKRGDLPTLDFPLVRISTETVHAIESGTRALFEGHVYFIEGAGLVKIGHTTDPIYRMRTIAAISPVPVRLLGSFPGKRAAEKALHEQFAPLRTHGEWFKIEGGLGDFLRNRGWLRSGPALAVAPLDTIRG
jgi:hypothetical protein